MMDSPNENASQLSCISSLRNRKRKAPIRYGSKLSDYYTVGNLVRLPPLDYDSIDVIPAKRICYSGTNIQSQIFSIPGPIVLYMAKNPKSPNLHEKLIQSCKYFFKNNQMISCSELKYIYSENLWQIEQDDIKMNINVDCPKLWISYKIDTNCVNQENINGNVISSLIPNIYQCHAYILKLQYQTLTYNEYIFLTSKARIIDFRFVNVNYDDDTVVPFEKCFEATIYAQDFKIQLDDNDRSVSQHSFRNLINIQHFSNLESLCIFNTPEDFDIDTFFTFVKTCKKIRFCISFHIISELLKNRLEEIVDEILTTVEHNYFPPIVTFFGIENQKFEELFRICKSHRLTI